jgi:hypothetical protein
MLSGCAASQATRESSAPAASDAMQVSEPVVPGAPRGEHSDYRQLIVHERELETLFLGVPDCDRACEHLAALCQLAERICALAVQEPDEALQSQCRDGRDRCERARARAASSCECSP